MEKDDRQVADMMCDCYEWELSERKRKNWFVRTQFYYYVDLLWL